MESGAHLLESTLGDPTRDRCIDLVGMSYAFTCTVKPWFFRDLRPTDERHHPARHRRRAGRDSHPATVRGQVGVAGSVVGRPVAGPAGDESQLVVGTRRGAEDAE